MSQVLPTISYPIDEVLQKKPWDLASSFRYCERLTRNHYENFPVGSILISKKLRPYVWAIYSFARRADDIADEHFSETDRIPALEAWQGLLEKSLRTRVNHPVFLALQETVRRFNIPKELFIDLITAFKMDVQVKRHARFQDLLYYCQHSANPVGRLVLLLFGHHDEKLMLLSDKICSALQLANFWQDISVDLEKDRIYLPLEDMRHFNYSEVELQGLEYNDAFKQLIYFQLKRTENMFREGSELIYQTSGRLRLELKCVVLGGMTILKKIHELEGNTLHTRPVIETRDKIKILLRSLWGFKKTMEPFYDLDRATSTSAECKKES